MTQDLTTLARFKQWYAVTQPALAVPNASTPDDGLIEDLITSASMDIMTFLNRPSLARATYPDYYNGPGGYTLMLRQWPVVAVNTLVIDGGTASTAAVHPNSGYFLEPYQGQPPGKQQVVSMIGASNPFPMGQQNVYVNYDAGYCVEDEAGTIGASPYKITAAQTYGLWLQDDGVTTAAGAAMTAVTGTPATGQYAVAAGVYTFAAADTGTDVLISYSYVPAAVEKACWKLMSEEYAYRQRTGQTSHSMGGQTTTSFDNSIMTVSIAKALQPFKRVVPFYA